MSGKSGAAKKLSLGKTLDLNEASALHTKLMALRGSNVSIDGSSVERAGALSIQVLMSAAKSWEEDKHSFSFSKISDALMKTMQLIGVNYDHLLAKESKS
jgi:chemotaxis protein CheX